MNSKNRFARMSDVDEMLGRIMKKRRPQPSLAMPPKRPFVSGCSPATGYQALAEGQNPPFGSPGWYTAHKLFVTAWGRACE